MRLANARTGSRALVRAEDERSDKMVVPSDSFGGLSPERKASQQLKRFFTFVAVKVVMHQMEGVAPSSSLKTETEFEPAQTEGKRATQRIRNDYDDLRDFYHNVPLQDADDWMEELVSRNKLLAMRVMEVRKAYATKDFEWGLLQKLVLEGLEKGNDQVLQGWVQKAYAHPAKGSDERSGHPPAPPPPDPSQQ